MVGINLVGGVVHDAREWEDRHAANLQWIDDQYQQYMGEVLAHADPSKKQTNNNLKFKIKYLLYRICSQSKCCKHRHMIGG
jgi:hypothetical protein